MKVTNACSCKICKNACHYRPCWGTPKDVKALLDAGYANRLMLDWWVVTGKSDIMIVAPAIRGAEGKHAPFIPKGTCTFLDANNLCELHDKNLKPEEGCWYYHNNQDTSEAQTKHKKMAMSWNTRKGRAVVETWKSAVSYKDNEEDTEETVDYDHIFGKFFSALE